MSCSRSSSSETTPRALPRLAFWGGGPVIAGRAVPYPSGELPEDFAQRLERLKQASGLSWDSFAEAIGVERKQVLRWRRGTEPSGSAYHGLVELARWIPGGIDILFGEDFLASPDGS